MCEANSQSEDETDDCIAYYETDLGPCSEDRDDLKEVSENQTTTFITVHAGYKVIG